MDILNLIAVLIIVMSAGMILLHAAVVFILKKRGIVAPDRTYRSERTFGTACWILLIGAMVWIITGPAPNDTFRACCMFLAATLFASVGITMLRDDMLLYRRAERSRVRAINRIHSPRSL